MSQKISNVFKEKHTYLIKKFFSRDKKYWPIFADKALDEIVKFRLNVKDYNSFKKEDLAKVTSKISKNMSAVPNAENDDILKSLTTSSKIWENPSSVENVVTCASDPGLYGFILGVIANPNLVYKEYAGFASEFEKIVVAQMSKLLGYDEKKSAGIFTQGGTFCNLYGYLVGIRKSIPYSRDVGLLGGDLDYRIINSMGGHYSNITNLSLLGVDIKNKTIRIKVGENNDMDIDNLESKMRSCFETNCVIPTIMLTMGTTDSFAIDNVKSVYDLREKLVLEYEIKVKPHIHVDSAVGWPIIFFMHYDFAKNPLEINQETLSALQKKINLFQYAKYADSFTIDFHKWGFVPYTSSLVLFKNKRDLYVLANSQDNFTYFEHTEGLENYHYTIECSRGAGGVYGAYTALKYMGIEGYQIAIAHALQNANYFREKLDEFSFVKVIASNNQGPNVCFRIYPKNINAKTEYQYEIDIKEDNKEWQERIAKNSKYHREIFLARKKIGLYTNWVESVSCSRFDYHNNYVYIPGEKAVLFNVRTSRKEIDLFIEYLLN